MRTILTLSNFVKKLGFSRANEKEFRAQLNHLLRIKAIEVQQGGFIADSMHHPKLVIIRNLSAIQTRFKFIAPQDSKAEKRHHSRKSPIPFQHRFDISEWITLGNVNEIITLGVPARGDGLCLYLPKDLCNLYDLIAGDRMKVHLLEHFRKRREE
jgi:hypothetical protein